MFLRHLELNDVRGLQHVELPFVDPAGATRPWTLLLGENGTGKSTLLRAIALATTGSGAITELIGRPDEWVRAGRTKARLRAIFALPDGEELEHVVEIRRTDQQKDVLRRNAVALDRLDRAVEQGALPTLGYGVARRPSESRLHERSRTGIIDPRAAAVATLFSPFAELVSMESWAMDLDYRRGATSLELVKLALRGVMMEEVEFKGIDRERRTLVFETPDGEFPFSQMSDGYQSVVAWIGDVLFRLTDAFRRTKDPLRTSGLLLVDEIDLHLHPVWQRRLVDYLRRTLPNFQVVATTHSALTAQQVGDGELWLVERDATRGPRVRALPGDPRKLFIHQLLGSPAFGVEMHSRYVERAQEQLADLRNKARSPSAAQRKELAKLSEALEDMPRWSRETAHDRERLALLGKIESQLASPATNRGATTSKKSARSKSRKAKPSVAKSPTPARKRKRPPKAVA